MEMKHCIVFSKGIVSNTMRLVVLLCLVSGLGLSVNASANLTASLVLSPSVAPGDPIRIKVTDGDLNTNATSPQTTTVIVVNNTTNESELVTLTEYGNNSEIFIGTLATVSSLVAGTDNDGTINLQPGSTSTTSYLDALDDNGASVTLTAVIHALGGTNFFSNFLQAAYYLPVFPLDGEQFGGDLTATYDQIYIPNRQNLELLIVGEYPRARYFSITAYDDHGAVIDSLYDAQIKPLHPTDTNPYEIGGPANTEDQVYAVRVQLGDQLVQTPEPGCQIDGLDTQSNTLDARFRHTAGARYSSEQSGFSATSEDGSVTVVHDDSLANKGAFIVIRRYLAENDGMNGAFNLTTPLVFLRDTTTGCAHNLFRLIGRNQVTPEERIKPGDWYEFDTIIDHAQLAAHDQHEKDTRPNTPFGLDPNNRAAWYAGPEYILTANPDTGYLATSIGKAGAPATLNLDGKVMRMRFRIPQVPCTTPSCALTGTEEMRYWGLSFVEGQRHVFASISDLDVTPDADGYVNLIVSFGTPLPPRINKDNGYSVLMLPELPLRLITIRNILPAAGFPCAISIVPFNTNEHNALNGYLGEYAPFIDYLVPTNLPLAARPRVETGSCQ